MMILIPSLSSMQHRIMFLGRHSCDHQRIGPLQVARDVYVMLGVIRSWSHDTFSPAGSRNWLRRDVSDLHCFWRWLFDQYVILVPRSPIRMPHIFKFSNLETLQYVRRWL
jgi:hypothetical protein